MAWYSTVMKRDTARRRTQAFYYVLSLWLAFSYAFFDDFALSIEVSIRTSLAEPHPRRARARVWLQAYDRFCTAGMHYVMQGYITE